MASRYTTVQKVLDRVGAENVDQTATTTVSEEALTFMAGLLTYTLSTSPVATITTITGTAGAVPVTFTPTTDYVLDGDNVVWQGAGLNPDDGTQFLVTYTYTNILNSIMCYIEDASACIEEWTGKTYGGGGATPEDVPILVRQVATDLATVYLLLRMSGGSGSTSTAGMAYSIGKLSVDNKSGTMSASLESEINMYLRRAEKGLKLLTNPPGEEGAPGSASHTLRMSRVTYNDDPDPYTGTQRLSDGTLRSVRRRV